LGPLYRFGPPEKGYEKWIGREGKEQKKRSERKEGVMILHA